MARVNIEDCWWTDPRRSKLIQIMGSELMADGLAIKAWRIAQEFWGRGQQAIPIDIFESIEANAKLIEAKLAEVRGGAVYVKGSSQYLEWIAERRAAAARGGKKSGEKRRSKSTNAESQSSTYTKQTPTKRNQTQPSDSGSYSGSDSGSTSLQVSENNLANASKSAWPAYLTAYTKKYGAEPIRNAKVNSLIKQLASRLPGEHLGQVIEFYLQHSGSYYVQRGHSLECLLRDAEKIYTEWKTGKRMTQKEASQNDSDLALAERLRKIEAGEL